MKMINNGEFLTGAMYAPFCRTLAWPMQEWDNDMKNMKELGYNCVHGFAEWHHIEYEKGKFDFTQVDHMVECAHRHGLVPIINVATQNSVGYYSPRWLMEEARFTTEGVKDNYGNAIPPSQFVVPCIDDKTYWSYAERFLKEVALHFGPDERVGGYVLWGEPFLKRPGYAGDEICYCHDTVSKFRNWLKEKYKTIDALNDIWSSEGPSDFADFDSVYPPTGLIRQKGGAASWEDWKEFMEWDLAGHIVAADKIFKENGALQPTITEMTTGINQSIDVWKLAKGTDIIGISCFDRPHKETALNMAISASMSKFYNKTTFVVEALGGSTKFVPFGAPSAEELKSTLLQRLGYGSKGLMYWCWRPRMSDIEGGDFGLAKANGKPLKKAVEVGKLANRMKELFPVYDSAVRKSDVAVLSSRQINHLMDVDFMKDRYLNSLTGANFLLSDLHINSDFITEEQIIKGMLKDYKTLVLPCIYIITEECGKAIAEFVQNGGQVIADFVLAEKKPQGFCYYELPGAGLQKVFGIDRDEVYKAEDCSTFEENSLGVVRNGLMDVISLTTAEAKEYYKEYPAVTVNNFGKGSAIYLAGQYFRTYCEKPNLEMRERIKKMLSENGVFANIGLVNEDKKAKTDVITVEMSFKDKGDKLAVVTVTNASGEPANDTLLLPLGDYKLVEENENVKITKEADKVKVDFSLTSWQSFAVYQEK